MATDSPALRSVEELSDVFRSSEKPEEQWRIGLEAEKFVVQASGGQPLPYSGAQGVEGVFKHLTDKYSWQPNSEYDGGPTVSLSRQESSITLEPAAQFELSGAPVHHLSEVDSELSRHVEELSSIENSFGVRFLHLGFHPWARHDELPWVPKRRYPIMKRYLPTKGSRGLDMMRRTATVQVNLDYASESDALAKLITLLRLTPVMQAMFANSPFQEGGVSTLLGERLDVWLNMDPSRSGLIQQLWDKPEPRYQDYVDWALDAGMFLFIRNSDVVENTGQTFRDFITHGFGDYRATLADWKLHLGTLFPEVRIKNTLEVRCADSLPPPLAMGVAALLVGISYDSASLSSAREIGQRIRIGESSSLQRSVAREGLSAMLDGQSMQHWCAQLVAIARAGLRRLGQEDHYLDALEVQVETGMNPAQKLLSDFRGSGQDIRSFLLSRPG